MYAIYQIPYNSFQVIVFSGDEIHLVYDAFDCVGVVNCRVDATK